jgi:predicted Zn finger-like uncharacterized protein
MSELERHLILFKQCPRCGGDVDATYHDDVRCVQCAYCPAVAFPGPRIVEPSLPGPANPFDEALAGLEGVAMYRQGNGASVCPKCGSDKTVRLDKLRPNDNTCLRCRSCGHIFSPGRGQAEAPSEIVEQ